MRQGLILITIILSVPCFATTWYVDSINGNDTWDGTNSAYVSGSIGPKKSIHGAVTISDLNDTIILLNGTYEGPQNGDSSVFNELDSKHIQLVSKNGPDQCIIKMFPDTELSHDPSGLLETSFNGITFTANPIPQAPMWKEDIFIISGFGKVFFGNCIFTSFEVVPSGEFVGSVVINVKDNAQVHINESAFTDNNMSCIIGGSNTSKITVISCSFHDNHFTHKSSPVGMQLIYLAWNASAEITNSEFKNNHSNLRISCIFCDSTNTLLVDGCNLINNTSSYPSYPPAGIPSQGIYCSGPGTKRILNTLIDRIVYTDNSTGDDWGNGIGISNFSSYSTRGDIQIRGCHVVNNPTGISYVSEHDYNDKVQIVDCDFNNNETALKLSPSDYRFMSHLLVKRCKFKNNRGGVYLTGGAEGFLLSKGILFDNCLIAGNDDFGIKLSDFDWLFWRPDFSINNCTIVNNGGIGLRVPEIQINNSIIYGNNNSAQQIETVDATTIKYCDIQNGWGGDGIGNIDTDPLFINSSDGNYRLSSNSICIDSGDPDLIADPNDTDLDGNPRIQNYIVDMGCYEYMSNQRPVADTGADQIVYASLDGTALVQLDGTDSTDADGDPLEYFWYNDVNELIATGAEPNVLLPVGEHVITLFVNDGIEDSQPDTCLVTVVEPFEALAGDIIELVQHDGVANSLLAKVDAAQKKLEDGNEKNDKAAVNSLNAFIHAVNAQRGKKISEADADALITAAEQIIDML